MRPLSKDILQKTRLTLLRSGVHVGLCFGILAAVANSPMDEHINTRITWPIDFQLRKALSLGPKIHEKLKIFSFDDNTLNWLQRANLELPEWQALLANIGAKRPSVIMIDKVFGIEDIPTGREREHKNAEAQLIRLKAPLVAGAFAAAQELRFRNALKLTGKDYMMDKVRRAGTHSAMLPALNERFKMAPLKNRFVYGPYEALRPAFSAIGHIHYEANHRITPYYRVDSKTVLPYFGVFATENHVYKGAELFLNNEAVPLLKDGSVLLNFPTYEAVMSANKSLRPELEKALNGRPNQSVSPGDVVMILPMMYTGNTDFKDTPLGAMPASLAHVAFVNSTLANDWLQPVEASFVVILLSCLFGALLARHLDNFWLLFAALLVCALIFAISQYVFSYHAVVLPWFYLCSGVLGASFAGFVYRSRINATKSMVLRTSLDGAIAPRDLKDLVSGTKKINLDAREHVVTVMFVDVVGYSLLSENQIPRVAFDQLKALLVQVTEEVHAFGGMVNKTLGDGLLCIFGYNFESESVFTDHAEKAVACAISIQEKNLRRNLHAAKRSEPVYPLRIGVHTSSVFLGDLGSGDRIDFTAIGNGVNFAKRMEQACDVHSVLFSGTTRDLVASLGLHSEGLKKRMISIKHHANNIEAFEYDPFFRHPEARTKALDAYRHCASLARTEQRYVFNHPEMLELKSSVGDAKLINFSVTGLSIKIKSHLVKGSVLIVNIDSRDNRVARQLQEAGIRDIKAEVRWAYGETDGTVHGLLYRNVNEGDAERLVEILKAYDLSVKLNMPTSRTA